jgi:glyoxylase-like metal-dependent hydrolase (beta-lactamase superfamily II)
MSVNSWAVGNIRIDRIVEFERPIFHPAEFFDEAIPQALDLHRHWLQPRALEPSSGNMIMPVQSWLLHTRHHRILIDTCIGCGKSYDGVAEWQNLRDPRWLRNLEATGVSPAEIDYVFCTHLHLDHCGWNTRLENGRWIPTFPNARYILARDEYAASEALDNSVFHENVLPIVEAGQAELVDQDFALDDEIWLTPSPGHTAGHVCVNFASRGQAAIMIGDTMHSPVQVAEPGWSPNFDHDREQSAVTRRNLLDRHCDIDHLVLTAHFPSPSLGHLVSHPERGFDFAYLDN